MRKRREREEERMDGERENGMRKRREREVEHSGRAMKAIWREEAAEWKAFSSREKICLRGQTVKLHQKSVGSGAGEEMGKGLSNLIQIGSAFGREGGFRQLASSGPFQPM